MKAMRNRLRQIRERRGVRGSAVAEYMGISPQYYYNLEKGTKRLNEDHIRKLVEFWSVSADELLGLPAVLGCEDLPALDGWRRAPDFPSALLMIKDIQDSHKLSPGAAMDMMVAAAAHFNFELPDVDPRQKAAHAKGPAASGGSGIFEGRRPSGR